MDRDRPPRRDDASADCGSGACSSGTQIVSRQTGTFPVGVKSAANEWGERWAHVSRSISADEHSIQLEVYAAAFRSADVIGAIVSNANGTIGVTMLEWAKTSVRVQAVGWI